MFLSATGLLLLFFALVWRSRAQPLSSLRAQAVADYDLETGLLLLAEKAQTRLPRTLLRGNRLASGSGVMLLRLNDEPAYATLLSKPSAARFRSRLGSSCAARREISTA